MRWLNLSATAAWAFSFLAPLFCSALYCAPVHASPRTRRGGAATVTIQQ